MSFIQKKEELSRLIEQQNKLEREIKEKEEKDKKMENNLHYAMDSYINEIYENTLINTYDFQHNYCGLSHIALNDIKIKNPLDWNNIQRRYHELNRMFDTRNSRNPNVEIKYLREFGNLLNNEKLTNAINETIKEQLPSEFKVLKTLSEIIKHQQELINHLTLKI